MSPQARPPYTPSVQELRALVLTADFGKVSEAAQAMNLTQSAVSRSVATLESRLGVRLFRRARQRMILTDAGRAMLRDARDILERLDSAARMVMAFGGGSEVLRIAALPTFATTWLIPKLPAFARAHPEVAIDLSEALGPVDFDNSPHDAAIQRIGLARPGTELMHLCAERLIVVAAPGLLGPDPGPEDLLRFPLIQLATRPELWSEWLAAAGADPVIPLRGPRFEHFDMVIAAAQAGMGVALLPDIFAAPALAQGSLVQLCSAITLQLSEYVLIRPAGRAPSASLALFCAWLEEAARAEQQAG